MLESSISWVLLAITKLVRQTNNPSCWIHFSSNTTQEDLFSVSMQDLFCWYNLQVFCLFFHQCLVLDIHSPLDMSSSGRSACLHDLSAVFRRQFRRAPSRWCQRIAPPLPPSCKRNAPSHRSTGTNDKSFFILFLSSKIQTPLEVFLHSIHC